MNRTVVRGRIAAGAAVLGACLAWLGVQTPAAEPPPSTFENAAFYYWKALAKLLPVGSAEDFEVVRFIDEELPELPPQVFGSWPEAAQRLVAERGLLSELRRGAALAHCRFTPVGSPPAQRDLSHRTQLRRVWRRGLAAAKALEFVGEDGGAAQLYLDLFRLLDHLDQDLDWMSAYVAMQWQVEWVRAIEGYILRNPQESAVQPLLDFLADFEFPRFPLQSFTEQERQTYLEWLSEDPERVEPRLLALYGNRSSSRPALQCLADLDPEEKRDLLDEWISGYRQFVDRLLACLKQPPWKAIDPIRKLDEEIEAIRRSPENLDQNHLLPLLLPPMERTYQQFVAAEGACTLVSMLGSGAVYRGLVGAWPETRNILEQFSGRTFPTDPFTGKPIDYRLRKALPVIGLDAPDWLRRDPRAVTEINLYRRFVQDEDAVDEAAGRIRERKERLSARENETKP